MPPMLVTPEVSQLDMSALKLRWFQQSPPISVMAETSQSAMGPYVATAAVWLMSNDWTAVFREAWLVKVPGGEGGGGVGGGGGGLGDGGGGDGDSGGGMGGGLGDGGGGDGDSGGEGQCVVSHFLNFLSACLNFFSHFVHFFLLPAASTPVARRSEMRSMIMSFIVWAMCVPARQGDGA